MTLKKRSQKSGKAVHSVTKKARLNRTMMDEQWKKHPGGG